MLQKRLDPWQTQNLLLLRLLTFVCVPSSPELSACCKAVPCGQDEISDRDPPVAKRDAQAGWGQTLCILLIFNSRTTEGGQKGKG